MGEGLRDLNELKVEHYEFFLAALFIVACGLTILETAANPYVSLPGRRLNFAQSFNGLAATLAPIMGTIM